MAEGRFRFPKTIEEEELCVSFHHSGKCAEANIIDKSSVSSCDSRQGKDGQVEPCNKDLLFDRESPKVKIRLS